MQPFPVLEVANADFVTPQLLVGGDLDTRSVDLALRQLAELVSVGVTHLVDVRIEWSDEEWVRGLAPELGYLHHGMDEAPVGGRVQVGAGSLLVGRAHPEDVLEEIQVGAPPLPAGCRPGHTSGQVVLKGAASACGCRAPSIGA